MTTNGQAPFITIFMNMKEMSNEQETQDLYLIIKEILNQRLEGIENRVGVKITTAFPKLVYVLNKNTAKNGKWYDLTQLSAKCTAKRLYPDYISEKKMSEIYEGNCFSPMG
jgi:anaerobic ribonucleoside-triphosphate reductase large subunit